MTDGRTGGKTPLRVLVLGGHDAVACLTHGDRPDPFRALVTGQRPGFDVEVVSRRSGPLGEVLSGLEAGALDVAGVAPDVVILSVSEDAAAASDRVSFETALADVARLVKPFAHVLVFLASSFDPCDQTTNYRAAGDTVSLRVHRLNRAAIAASASEGISVVDVDRIVAELGGDRHVDSVLRYSTQVEAAIREEVLAILDDYGFFEDRPLVPQIASRAR